MSDRETKAVKMRLLIIIMQTIGVGAGIIFGALYAFAYTMLLTNPSKEIATGISNIPPQVAVPIIFVSLIIGSISEIMEEKLLKTNFHRVE